MNLSRQGMGEPLNNYDSVRSAVAMMTEPRYFALRRGSVTVSTVGVIPRILQLATDLPGVSLALSLHAPNQELRKSIVPSAAAYKLDKLMAAIDTYQQQTKQRVSASALNPKLKMRLPLAYKRNAGIDTFNQRVPYLGNSREPDTRMSWSFVSWYSVHIAIASKVVGLLAEPCIPRTL